MTTALLPEHRQDEDTAHDQLALDGEAFQHMKRLADAGAITATSLALDDPSMSYDTYEALGAYIGRMNRSCSWWVGDWLAFGEGAFPDRYPQAAAATGLAEQTLLNRVYVCKNVPPSRRRAALSFSVHSEVAPLPAKEQKQWLDKAERHGWTQRELRAAMKATRKDERPALTDGEEPDAEALMEVALAILRDVTPHIDGQHQLVPNEDIARLRAALGQEED
jgi:hypothetical protein